MMRSQQQPALRARHQLKRTLVRSFVRLSLIGDDGCKLTAYRSDTAVRFGGSPGPIERPSRTEFLAALRANFGGA